MRIVLTVCGNETLPETFGLIKSAITLSWNPIRFIIFIDSLKTKSRLNSLVWKVILILYCTQIFNWH